MIKVHAPFDEVRFKIWQFPAGETGVEMEADDFHFVCDFRDRCWVIYWDYQGDHEMMQLAQIMDILRAQRINSIDIHLSYIPHARQDRATSVRHPFALRVFARQLNDLKFNRVFVNDPHSDVSGALIDNMVVRTQLQCLVETCREAFSDISGLIIPPVMRKQGWEAVVAPDVGASKKAFLIAQTLGLPLVIANKHRDLDGNIDGYRVYDFDGYKCMLVVDDICDGGRTFLELARAVHAKDGEVVLDLFTTHGIYSAGREALEAEYRNVLAYNRLDQIGK